MTIEEMISELRGFPSNLEVQVAILKTDLDKTMIDGRRAIFKISICGHTDRNTGMVCIHANRLDKVKRP